MHHQDFANQKLARCLHPINTSDHVQIHQTDDQTQQVIDQVWSDISITKVFVEKLRVQMELSDALVRLAAELKLALLLEMQTD